MSGYRCIAYTLTFIQLYYLLLVLIVESASQIFLKTSIPSRKATGHYLKAGPDEQDETG
jgi:hypothetical protein